MAAPIPYDALTATLDAHQQAYGVLHWANGARLVITQRGGRCFGPFLPAPAISLTWTHPALYDPVPFGAFLAAGEWNMGGERVWIAPEIQFIIQDRRDFWGTHRLPAALDPGQYDLTAAHPGWRLAQTCALAAYNLGSGSKTLHIDRRIVPVPNPLRTLRQHDALMADVLYMGYAQSVTLTELDAPEIVAEAWNLVQLNPGGQLLIPCAPDLEAAPYFGDPAPDALTPQAGALRIHLTGSRQYKVGYAAAGLTGRMAYWQTLADGRAALLVRHFDANPSAHYSEEPPAAPGANGFAIHVYNDGGQFGANGEMEANGQAIGGSTRRTNSHDTFTLWAFVGAPERIRALGRLLLAGVSL